ncbi:MAG: small multi-drug export protein [Clostridia bacterium]|nr:small multi-drug export protein [Clostridia bacterium]
MALKIGEFLIGVFGSKYVAVLFVSMFPLIELKGAIPIGMSEAFSMGLLETAAIAYIGSTVVSFALFFLLIPIFNLLKKIKFIEGLIKKIENVFKGKAEKIALKTQNSAEDEAKRIMMLSLFLFVAVPFPITGVWTGTAIAVFLGLKFRESVLPIALGNLVAGAVVTLLTYLFKGYVDYIIYALFLIAIIMLVVFIIKIAKSKPEER